MAVTLSKYGSSINRLLCHLVGLSTDTKPIGTYTDKSGKVFLLENGSSFEEMDTDKKYSYDAENQQWNLASSGGGGGGSATLIEKSITENGEYNASADNADGYSKVTVDVAGGGGGETFEVNLVCDSQTSSFTTDKSYDTVKAAIQANKVVNFIWSVLFQGAIAASGTTSAVSFDSEGDFMSIVASIILDDSSGCFLFQWGNPEVYTTVSTGALPVFGYLE